MIVTSLLKKKILYLILLILVIYLSKPPILFKPNGKLREYGIGTDSDGYKKTLYSFQYVIILSVLLVVFLIKS